MRKALKNSNSNGHYFLPSISSFKRAKLSKSPRVVFSTASFTALTPEFLLALFYFLLTVSLESRFLKF